MADHGARAHSDWSASSTARNWACSGALALISRLTVPDKESEAAAWGTACHQVSEKCLRSGGDAVDYVGTVEKTKEHEIEVDDELAECAQVYVDYCRSLQAVIAVEGGVSAIEQKFSLAKIDPPIDAGGTADFTAYLRKQKLLEVVDLKGGRGVVVEVKGNPQLRTYALGALLANPGLDIETVKVTIVQPRAGHKDGRTRSEDFHVMDLLEWALDLKGRMNVCNDALLDARNIDPFKDAAWAAKYLDAGSHCKFCPATATCPSIEQKVLDTVGVWFDDLDNPKISNAPDKLSPEQIAAKLDLSDMIEDWVSAMRAYAHTLAEGGGDIPGYMLVDKVGRRAWAADETKVASDLLKVVKLPEDDIYARKLKTPAQIEKVLGAKRKAEISSMWHTPTKGTNLVRRDKTSRPEAVPAVNKFFSPVTDD